jgi:2,4-dienoyl-CoA reductase-like NADH-dependent reductase (Old Yellow Enzyme family)
VQRESLLFSPINVNGLILKNRITMAPLFLGHAGPDGMVSQLMLAHYLKMAESGAALIVVENAAVDLLGRGSPLALMADDDSCINGLTALARLIHQSGALAILQINHAGRYAFSKDRIAPSPVPMDGVAPREMTAKEIDQVARAFAGAAKRVKTAGFDGVELHGGTGYLLSQFLSPRVNKRTDGYGGTLEKRMRFPLEVYAAVRDAVGNEYPVSYRFLADELMPEGLTMDETELFAKELEKKGVAYLSVMAGVHESFRIAPYADMEKEEGYMVPFAHRIKKAATRTPVIAAGRIQTPEFAEKVLREGKADLIGLARVLFADPLWPKKAAGLVPDAIIPCGDTCSLCTSQVMLGKPAYCSTWDKEERKSFLERTGGGKGE